MGVLIIVVVVLGWGTSWERHRDECAYRTRAFCSSQVEQSAPSAVPAPAQTRFGVDFREVHPHAQ